MLKADRSMSNPNLESVEMRYQKALKEITKLIEANNLARQQSRIKGKMIENLQDENKKFNDLVEKQREQKRQIEQQLCDLSLKYQDLEEQNISLAKSPKSRNRIEKKTSLNYYIQTDIQNISTISEDDIFIKKKVEKYNEVILQQKRKIQELEYIGKNKTSRLQKLANQTLQLKQKVRQQEMKLEDFENFQLQKYNFSSESSDNLNDLSKSKLLRKYTVTNKWASNIEQECTELKSQVTNQFMRVKSQENFSRLMSPISSIRSSINVKQFANENQSNNQYTQILKKGKKAEAQNKLVREKYKKIKEELKKLKTELQSDKKQLQKLRKQNEGYGKIIQKQQSEMKILMEQSEKDIRYLTEEFRAKLEEQRKMFGEKQEEKRAQNFEELQNEIKILRKKFQICSQQLTKCYKLLEYEKAKTAQVESFSKQLAEQNHKLKELIKNMSRPQSLSPKKQEPKFINESSLIQSARIPSPMKKSYRRQSFDESSVLKKTREVF